MTTPATTSIDVNDSTYQDINNNNKEGSGSCTWKGLFFMTWILIGFGFSAAVIYLAYYYDQQCINSINTLQSQINTLTTQINTLNSNLTTLTEG